MSDVETSKARLRLWLKILKTSKVVEAELREKMRKEFATTLPRFDVMAALSRTEDGLRMSQISGVLKVSNGNITGIVERLVNEKLAVRTPFKGDRRALVIKLTAKGRRTFDMQAAEHEIWVANIFEQVNQAEAENLISALENITNKEAVE